MYSKELHFFLNTVGESHYSENNHQSPVTTNRREESKEPCRLIFSSPRRRSRCSHVGFIFLRDTHSHMHTRIHFTYTAEDALNRRRLCLLAIFAQQFDVRVPLVWPVERTHTEEKNRRRTSSRHALGLIGPCKNARHRAHGIKISRKCPCYVTCVKLVLSTNSWLF